MKYNTVIFDLDGTLLDTLQDLTDAVNYALTKMNYTNRTIDEVRSFVGNGIRVLMERSVPDGTDEKDYEEAFNYFVDYYKTHCMDNTRPYEGIVEMLEKVRALGYKTAIVSNKGQFAVDELYNLYFKDTVDTAVGNSKGLRTKPNPDEVLKALEILQSEAKDCIYVGDSEVDMKTAENTALPCISVAWGFRTIKFLEEHNAKIIIEKPSDIFKYI